MTPSSQREVIQGLVDAFDVTLGPPQTRPLLFLCNGHSPRYRGDSRIGVDRRGAFLRRASPDPKVH